MKLGSRIYRKLVYGDRMLPVPLRRALLMAPCKQETRLIARAEAMPAEQFNQMILRRISALADYAYEHVPYYREAYGKQGFRPGDIRSVSDFESLPCVDKDTIKQHFEEFCSDELASLKHRKDYTGGSTDKPMAFLRDHETVVRARAYFAEYWKQYGFIYGCDRCVILRGHHISKASAEKLFDYDVLQNYKRFDSGYVSEQKYVAEYKKQMECFGARVMQAYPSSVYSLAKTFESSGIEPPQFDLILLGSENNYPEQIAYIQKMYRAKRVMYHYGLSESVSLAIKYRDSDCLGFMQTYGYSELVNGAQHAVTRAGEIGEIVGTSYNKAMPLIRYSTGDYAMKSDYRSDDWMRNCPSIERIEGRKHEFIVTKDLRLASLCYIAGAHMPSLSLIGDMQYYQDTPGKLLVRVTGIAGEPASEAAVQGVAREFANMFEDSMEIDVQPVEQIERTALNKRIMIEQKLNVDLYRV